MVNDNKGWECPKCGACYAPWKSKCDSCAVASRLSTKPQDGLTPRPNPYPGIYPPDHVHNSGCGCFLRATRTNGSIGGVFWPDAEATRLYLTHDEVRRSWRDAV